jgi:hypothetical protein
VWGLRFSVPWPVERRSWWAWWGLSRGKLVGSVLEGQAGLHLCGEPAGDRHHQDR